MKYVWMIIDSASDFEPPELFSSRKRAITRMEELFEETLNSFINEPSEEEKINYRKEFKKCNRTFFVFSEEVNRNKIIWARSCSLEKVYLK